MRRPAASRLPNAQRQTFFFVFLFTVQTFFAFPDDAAGGAVVDTAGLDTTGLATVVAGPAWFAITARRRSAMATSAA